MEYCGEVCTLTDFEARKVEYVRVKRRHYYFMSLRTDEVRSASYMELNTKCSRLYCVALYPCSDNGSVRQVI